MTETMCAATQLQPPNQHRGGPPLAHDAVARTA